MTNKYKLCIARIKEVLGMFIEVFTISTYMYTVCVCIRTSINILDSTDGQTDGIVGDMQ